MARTGWQLGQRESTWWLVIVSLKFCWPSKAATSWVGSSIQLFVGDPSHFIPHHNRSKFSSPSALRAGPGSGKGPRDSRSLAVTSASRTHTGCWQSTKLTRILRSGVLAFEHEIHSQGSVEPKPSSGCLRALKTH